MSLSPRLQALVTALPLAPGMQVLEIGCGPGAAARAVAERLTAGRVLGIDRSDGAIRQAQASAPAELAGRLEFRRSAIEDFIAAPGDPPFDLVFAFRVGALDGRHPEAGRRALARIAAVLAPGGRLLIDDEAAGPGRLRDLSC